MRDVCNGLQGRSEESANLSPAFGDGCIQQYASLLRTHYIDRHFDEPIKLNWTVDESMTIFFLYRAAYSGFNILRKSVRSSRGAHERKTRTMDIDDTVRVQFELISVHFERFSNSPTSRCAPIISSRLSCDNIASNSSRWSLFVVWRLNGVLATSNLKSNAIIFVPQRMPALRQWQHSAAL